MTIDYVIDGLGKVPVRFTQDQGTTKQKKKITESTLVEVNA